MTTEDPNPATEPEGAQNPAVEPDSGTEDPDTFPREYVERLRTEAAENRTKAKEATAAMDTLREALHAAYLREGTRGILQDPEALPWSEEFNGEDDMPDVDKIREAAEALAQDKPYLSRPRGDVGQGFRGEDSDSVDLAGMLKAGA